MRMHFNIQRKVLNGPHYLDTLEGIPMNAFARHDETPDPKI